LGNSPAICALHGETYGVFRRGRAFGDVVVVDATGSKPQAASANTRLLIVDFILFIFLVTGIVALSVLFKRTDAYGGKSFI
jgi:hypothetical protein